MRAVARGIHWGLAFSLLWVVFASSSVAQIASDELSVPPPDPAPEIIAASSVAGRSDALGRELRQVKTRLAPSGEREEIAFALTSRVAAIAALRANTSDRLAGQPTLADLAEMEREWAAEEVALADWSETLTRRGETLERELAGLDAKAKVWSDTLEQSRADDAPQEVIAAVTRSIAAIGEVRQVASTRRSEVLALQNRVAEQESEISESVSMLRDTRAQLRGQLLEPDRPPIWSAVAGSSMASSDRLAAAASEHIGDVREFIEASQARLLTLGLFFVLALMGAVGLQHSIVVRRAAGGEIENASRVFEHPLAMALLLTLLGFFWLFPLAPEAAIDVVGLLLLAPLLRLLPLLMHSGFHPILYGVATFYVVDRLRDLFENAPLEGRIAFAVECVAAAGFCYLLLRPHRLAGVDRPDTIPHWMGRALRFALAVFVIAVVANLFGYVSLSQLLGDGLLTSIYIGIGLYAAGRVVSTVVDVATKTAWAQHINVIRSRRSEVVGFVQRAASIVAPVLWVYWSLGAFAIQDTVVNGITGLLTHRFELGSLSIAIGDVFAFGVMIAAAVFLARGIRFVLMEDVFTRIKTGRGIPHAISATVHYAILFAGFTLALAAAGIDFTKFTLLAGAFGVGLGFGLQNIVNNFVSGIILLYERPIQVGDAIDMGDLTGHVKRIGIRSSTLRTLDGSEVIVPNADLISQRVVNWTLSDRTRRLDIPIGVKYGTDPDEVIELLSSIPESHDQVLRYPKPVVLFRAHGASSLDFELRIWIKSFDDSFHVESDMNQAINRALTAADIEIPFPQRDLHVRSVAPEVTARLAGRESEETN